MIRPEATPRRGRQSRTIAAAISRSMSTLRARGARSSYGRVDPASVIDDGADDRGARSRGMA
jgi:hypothetical protein